MQHQPYVTGPLAQLSGDGLGVAGNLQLRARNLGDTDVRLRGLHNQANRVGIRLQAATGLRWSDARSWYRGTPALTTDPSSADRKVMWPDQLRAVSVTSRAARFLSAMLTKLSLIHI